MEGRSPQIGRESFHRPLRAMKTPDQFSRRSYWSGGTTASSGGTTPANVNRSVIRKSPRLAAGSTGFHLGRAAQ